MKTAPLKHQRTYLKLCAGKPGFATFGEQGTGKTWMLLADGEREFGQGRIDGILIVAPRGVHINWIRREIPKHLSAAHIAAWYSPSMGKKQRKALDAVFAPREHGAVAQMRILAINYDALLTKAGFTIAMNFVRSMRTMVIADESSRIKNMNAARTKRVHSLGMHAVQRRIGTGTPITQSPGDLFAQFEFIEPGCLGTSSYRSFVTEYAELLPPQHGLMRHIAQRLAIRRGWNPEALSDYQMGILARSLPQMVAKDPDGTPRWRNLEKLKTLIAPLSYRVLKKDCLDLPKKVFKQAFFELTPSQRKIYDKAHDELRIELGDELLIMKEMTALNKLQQITSGFVLLRGKAHLMPPEDNPRMFVFCELVEDITGQFIVWAKYREELRQIAAVLKSMGIESVQYHGGVKPKERDEAEAIFQAGKVRAFVGQPHSGGIGITLTAAHTVVRYSSDYNWEDYVQSEDRAHRIGTEQDVLYIDLMALDTVDEKICANLENKTRTAFNLLDS